MPCGSGYKPRFFRLRMLKCPAQCVGIPTSVCSSKTVVATPSFARFIAAKHPTGPAPTTTASETFFICYTLKNALCLLDEFDAFFPPSHGACANLAADFEPH